MNKVKLLKELLDLRFVTKELKNFYDSNDVYNQPYTILEHPLTWQLIWNYEISVEDIKPGILFNSEDKEYT